MKQNRVKMFRNDISSRDSMKSMKSMNGMNKQGRVIVQLLIFLVVIALTSALILLLVKTNIISVGTSTATEPVLNAEFIPFAQTGSFAIRGFLFCTEVIEGKCVDSSNLFIPGSRVNFVVTLESATVNNRVLVVENYQIRAPDGSIVLQLDTKDNFQFETTSSETEEHVKIHDYFIIDELTPAGDYTLDLLIENPLLDKQATLSRTFEVSLPHYEVDEFTGGDEE